MDGDPRGGGGHLRRPNRRRDVLVADRHLAGRDPQVEPPGQRRHRVPVVRVDLGPDRGQRDAPVHRPGVQVGEAEALGERPGDR